MHQVKHETWRGEIGNCISTPKFEFKIGFESRREVVKCIRYDRYGFIDFYTVFWAMKTAKKVIDNHRE